MSHSPNSGYGSHTPMTAAIQSAEPTRLSDPESKPAKMNKEMEVTEKDSSNANRAPSLDSGSMESTYDHTHRKLKPRHVQLIGIGGTIGTALYVQIGSGLRTSGPASLFIGFSLWLVFSLLYCFVDSIGFSTWVVPTLLLWTASTCAVSRWTCQKWKRNPPMDQEKKKKRGKAKNKEPYDQTKHQETGFKACLHNFRSPRM